ncbi:conserved hypothetical protein [delta proteobacterium NaphS2]|nr:conserved hypothetical protein [delta proteobacterium NaphS2]
MESFLSINFFDSYEEQLDHFAKMTKVSLLPMTKGRLAFLGQLGIWFRDYGSEDAPLPVSYILSNPSQGMSFPTPADVLGTVLAMYMDTHNVDCEAVDLLAEFGLDDDKASQSIVSLSGGELLLLNYAKAKAMLPMVNGLVACSPVYWLNKLRYKYWDALLADYTNNSRAIDVALLEGEEFPNHEDCTAIVCGQQTDPKRLRWKLLANNPKVVFPEIQFPSHHPEFSLHFLSEVVEFDLMSPTLVTGDNGIGKSILAKVMAGIITPVEGSIFSLSENGKGNARLILQDSIHQLFGMSVDNHLDWAFRFDGTKANAARSIYSNIEKSLKKLLNEMRFESLTALGEAGQRSTLLQAKICLVAERIASLPPLLILDEPGWGLSKTSAQCLVWEICKQAHDHGIAVAIISHHPSCWDGLINSQIELTKCEKGIINLAMVEK